jgi:ankyrin repeat protein
VVRLLLGSNGVDPDSKDFFGQTPPLWAAENGHEAVVKLLRDLTV